MQIVLPAFCRYAVMACLLLYGTQGGVQGGIYGPPTKEARQRIAVLDTGLAYSHEMAPYLCDDGHFDVTPDQDPFADLVGHGTNVAWLISQEIDARYQCITVVKWYGRGGGMLMDAMAYAITLNPAVVNISAGGPYYSVAEEQFLDALTRRGAVVVVAAGNSGMDLSEHCEYYPACGRPKKRSNLIVVGALSEDGKRKAPFSNYGGPVNRWEIGTEVGPEDLKMSGTSQATATASGKIASELLRAAKKN